MWRSVSGLSPESSDKRGARTSRVVPGKVVDSRTISYPFFT